MLTIFLYARCLHDGRVCLGPVSLDATHSHQGRSSSASICSYEKDGITFSSRQGHSLHSNWMDLCIALYIYIYKCVNIYQINYM